MLKTNYVQYILHKYLLAIPLTTIIGLSVKTNFFNYDYYITAIAALFSMLLIIIFLLYFWRVQAVTMDKSGIRFRGEKEIIRWEEVESVLINGLGQYKVSLKDDSEFYFYGSGAEKVTFLVTLWEEEDEILAFVKKMRLIHEFPFEE